MEEWQRNGKESKVSDRKMLKGKEGEEEEEEEEKEEEEE